MKKKLFLIVLCAVCINFNAQIRTFGIKSGLNISSISKEGYDKVNAKAGFSGGFFMNSKLNENLNLQTEIIYNQTGAKVSKSTYYITNNTTTIQRLSDLRLNYLSLPLLLQYNVTPKFFAEAGPEVGFLLNARAAGSTDKIILLTDGVTTYQTNYSSSNVKKYFCNVNVSIDLGLGYFITDKLSVNARYVAGISNINKKNNGTAEQDFVDNYKNKNRNNTAQVGIAYKF